MSIQISLFIIFEPTKKDEIVTDFIEKKKKKDSSLNACTAKTLHKRGTEDNSKIIFLNSQ